MIPIDKNYTMKIDLLNKRDVGIEKEIFFNKNDFETATIVAEIVRDNEVVDLTGAKADISVKKSNGNMVLDSCEIVDEKKGIIKIKLTRDMIDTSGLATFQISIRDDDTMVMTNNYYFTITSPIIDEIDLEDSNSYPLLIRISKQSKEFLKRAEDVTRRVETLEVRYTNTERERSIAEDKRIKQENDRLENESQRIEKENERLSEENLRKIYENRRKESENKRDKKENERIEKENNRIENEDIRKNNESQRLLSEESRNKSELERNKSENDREDNEEARKNNELNRQNIEKTRVSKENTRIENENERIENETTRKNNEKNRITKETERINEEEKRVSDENIRVTNEKIREEKEEIRQKNEKERVISHVTSKELIAEMTKLTKDNELIKRVDSKADKVEIDKFIQELSDEDINVVTEDKRLSEVLPTMAKKGEILPQDIKGNALKSLIQYISMNENDNIAVEWINSEGLVRKYHIYLSEKYVKKTDLEYLQSAIDGIKQDIGGYAKRLENVNKEIEARL